MKRNIIIYSYALLLLFFKVCSSGEQYISYLIWNYMDSKQEKQACDLFEFRH